MKFYEYQRSRSFIDLDPDHSDSIFLNFVSSITADFNISSALRWAIQDQWSSGLTIDTERADVNEPPHDKTNKMACAPSKDSDQSGHPPSLIRVFAVHMKKTRVLSYSLSAQQRLWSDRLIWVFTGHTVILLVLSWGGSNDNLLLCRYERLSALSARKKNGLTVKILKVWIPENVL